MQAARAAVIGVPPDLPSPDTLGGRLLRDAVTVAAELAYREHHEALADRIGRAVAREFFATLDGLGG